MGPRHEGTSPNAERGGVWHTPPLSAALAFQPPPESLASELRPYLGNCLLRTRVSPR